MQCHLHYPGTAPQQSNPIAEMGCMSDSQLLALAALPALLAYSQDKSQALTEILCSSAASQL